MGSWTVVIIAAVISRASNQDPIKEKDLNPFQTEVFFNLEI